MCVELWANNNLSHPVFVWRFGCYEIFFEVQPLSTKDLRKPSYELWLTRVGYSLEPYNMLFRITLFDENVVKSFNANTMARPLNYLEAILLVWHWVIFKIGLQGIDQRELGLLNSCSLTKSLVVLFELVVIVVDYHLCSQRLKFTLWFNKSLRRRIWSA